MRREIWGKPGRSRASAALKTFLFCCMVHRGAFLHLRDKHPVLSFRFCVLFGAWASEILRFTPPQHWNYKHNPSRPTVYMGSRDQTLVLRLVLQALDWVKCPPSPKILPTPTILSNITFLSQVSAHPSCTCGIFIYMLHVITGMSYHT